MVWTHNNETEIDKATQNQRKHTDTHRRHCICNHHSKQTSWFGQMLHSAPGWDLRGIAPGLKPNLKASLDSLGPIFKKKSDLKKFGKNPIQYKSNNYRGHDRYHTTEYVYTSMIYYCMISHDIIRILLLYCKIMCNIIAQATSFSALGRQ